MTDDERRRLGRVARDAWNEATIPEVVPPGTMPPMSWDDMPDWLQQAWGEVAECVLATATPKAPAAIVILKHVPYAACKLQMFEAIPDAERFADEVGGMLERVAEATWHPAAPAGEGEGK